MYIQRGFLLDFGVDDCDSLVLQRIVRSGQVDVRTGGKVDSKGKEIYSIDTRNFSSVIARKVALIQPPNIRQSRVAIFCVFTASDKTPFSADQPSPKVPKMLSLPPELFLRILEYLEEDFESIRAATAIIRLSQTCQGVYKLIERWAACKTSYEVSILSKLPKCAETQSSTPPSSLSILCRKIGGVCIFCSNRARYSPEMFTNLKVCSACEALRLPKISDVNLKRLYAFADGTEDILETMESRENLDHRLYRWCDIERLVTRGLLSKRPNFGVHHRSKFLPFNPEEYAEFCFHQHGITEVDYRDLHHSYLGVMFIEGIIEHWNIDSFNKYCPVLFELALYNDFRYRYDYSWTPKPTPKDQVAEFAHIARHWVRDKGLWSQRPWRLSAVPQTPRCCVTNPFAKEYHKSVDREAFLQYQQQCQLWRALIRAYPSILSNPDVWCQCVSFGLSEMDDAVDLAVSSRGTERVPLFRSIDFELLTNFMGSNVDFLRAAKHQLTPQVYQQVFEQEDITRSKVAVVSIRNGMVRVKVLGQEGPFTYWEDHVVESEMSQLESENSSNI